MNIALRSLDSLESPCSEISKEWFGNPLSAPYRYSFTLEDGDLVYRASCDAPALVHPDAKEGAFQENLWMYDAAEFFIAREDLSCYIECNVSPNGAWWSEVFSAPRVLFQEGYPVPPLVSKGELRSDGWSCEARLPLAELEKLGISLDNCRVAACAILNSPAQLFATTASDCSGDPDFHRPYAWLEFEKV